MRFLQALFMQIDKPAVKRTFSQSAPFGAIPSKLPRVIDRVASDLDPFSAVRRSPPLWGPHASLDRVRPASASSFHTTTLASSSHRRTSRRGGKNRTAQVPKDLLQGPYHNERYIERQFGHPLFLKDYDKHYPKAALNQFCVAHAVQQPSCQSTQGTLVDGGQPRTVWRSKISIDMDPPIIGIGDHPEKKQSASLASLSILYRLQQLDKLGPLSVVETTEVALSDGTIVDYEKARAFVEYYCRKYHFQKPDIQFVDTKTKGWEATIIINGRRVGLGSASSKKKAQVQCYLDVTKYLESCDPPLWADYRQAVRKGSDLMLATPLSFLISPRLEDSIANLCDDIRGTALYKNRPRREAQIRNVEEQQHATKTPRFTPPKGPSIEFRRNKSKKLLQERNDYSVNPIHADVRNFRQALPVYAQAKDILGYIETNEVTILMAATGSGKTTQLPQMILDEYIARGEGANCNIVCTQPRRLAAISVADRVAKERGEILGRSVGYQVRFEANAPEANGSITFCTTGVFLKLLQTALSDGRSSSSSMSLDNVTHIIVDEVHERDVDIDLLLAVLKHLMTMKKNRRHPLKVILMSATIDPTLFQNYFADESGNPVKAIEIPGRSFPVQKRFLEDFVYEVLEASPWLAAQDSVSKYIARELGPVKARELGLDRYIETGTKDLDLPYPLVGATIAHVLKASDDGHVLVFLPGWDDIIATQRALLEPFGCLPIDFSDRSKYIIHHLHSSIPLAEQQVIFNPPPKGVRRIILATNIAETSVTIPDVVYVIDTAKIKEMRYDPERHISSLVSAWVGSSNLNQRAGRAGRHRSGEYFGILSASRAESLHPYQTVEMKRVDLSNVVMHIKALNIPGMTVEEVLAATLEPPDPERVGAAISDLKMVGALDEGKNLTSLGRVLLQLPVDVQVGRLVLFGSFFRCLDDALTLAAILTNRDPFLSPLHLREEAQRKKNSWAPLEFRSDPLTTLGAFKAWWELQSRGQFVSANQLCVENFLSKPTLLLIQKIKGHLFQALCRAGVIDVSADGQVPADQRMGSSRNLDIPAALNVNRDCLPLLTALIAIASQPKFAIRINAKIYRTSNDKVVHIHPSSVNGRKHEVPLSEGSASAPSKELYAFSDKRRNDTIGSPQTFLLGTTRVDPLTYLLFGAHKIEAVEKGLQCDGWLPVHGDVQVLDDIQTLKTYIDGCMLRVFEGITMGRRHPKNVPILPRSNDIDLERDDECSYEGPEDYSLSRQEVHDLDMMTKDVVNILITHSEERADYHSPGGTPRSSPFNLRSFLPLEISALGQSTPGFYNSQPGTPRQGLRRL